MATVYLVTRGEYSDYRVLAAFSSREAADAAVTVLNQSSDMYEAGVEEYELDTYVDHYQRGELLYSLLLFRDSDRGPWVNVDHAGEEHTEFGTDGRNGPYLRIARWATSQEAVIKIANEIRMQQIALDRWGG